MASRQILMLFCLTSALGMPETSEPNVMQMSPLETMKLQLAEHIKSNNPAMTQEQWEKINAILTEFEQNFLVDIKRVIETYTMTTTVFPEGETTTEKDIPELSKEFQSFRSFLLKGEPNLNEEMATQITKELQINLIETKDKLEILSGKFKQDDSTRVP